MAERAERVRPFTPETLAAYWKCSPGYVRALVRRKELRAFKLGGKLIRIPVDAVEEYECRSQTTGSPDTEESLRSSGMRTATDSAARLARMIGR